jgi:hypothetical protein
MCVLPEEVGCLRRALEDAGTLFAEVEGEVANAAQVFETLAGRAAWYSAPRIVKAGAKVSASGVVYALNHRLVHIELEAGAFAEEVDLVEEGLHLFRGVGDQAQVIRIA